jgi:uncharacterized integral membrane protein
MPTAPYGRSSSSSDREIVTGANPMSNSENGLGRIWKKVRTFLTKNWRTALGLYVAVILLFVGGFLIEFLLYGNRTLSLAKNLEDFDKYMTTYQTLFQAWGEAITAIIVAVVGSVLGVLAKQAVVSFVEAKERVTHVKNILEFDQSTNLEKILEAIGKLKNNNSDNG